MRVRRDEKSGETLGELLLGIILYAVVVLVIGVIILPGRLFYALGFAGGTVAAIFIVINMYDGLNEALTMRGADSAKYVMRKSVMRLLIAMFVMMAAVIIDKYCFVGACLSLISIKISAAFNRVIHRKLTISINPEPSPEESQSDDC